MKNTIAKYDKDCILYKGDISRTGYNRLTDVIEKIHSRRPSVCLILSTRGGDPDAAYRMGRALHHYYKKIEMIIPGLCKSAGTLLTVAAHNIVIGDRGELGPLDIQLSKPDELNESMSGLDIIQAINAMELQALKSFRRYMVDIRNGARLRTKMAADLAVQLTEKCIAPIASKIDPLTLGEHQRAMQIAMEYGQRLNDMAKNLKEDALMRLVASYPCHGFVIDRKEAKDLFENISKPEKETLSLYEWSRDLIKHLDGQPMTILNVNEIINQNPEPTPSDEGKSHDAITENSANTTETSENEKPK